MSTDFNVNALAIRGLPAPISNNVRGPVRASRYGELMTMPVSEFRKVLAAQGTYFVAHNATNDASTTIAGHAAPVLADADATMTKPFLHVVNSDAASTTKLAYLDFVEIEVVTAGANGTQACWAAQLDTGATRITTAGTALTAVNPNMQSTATPVLAPTAGAIVTGVESANVRHLGHGTIRPSIEIAGDVKMFVFGGDPAMLGTGAGQAAASIRTSLINLPPVLLGYADAFLLALHGQASQSAAGVYKIRMGWWEL